MSKILIWIVGIIVLVGAGVGLWMSGWINMGTPTPAPTSNTTTTNTQANNTQQPPQQTAQTDLPTQTGDNSDAALTQDAAAVDAQMNAYSTDSANVDQSLNDKPTAQEY